MLLLTQARRRIHLRKGGKKKKAERVRGRARRTGRGRAKIQVLGELRARRGWEPPHPSLQILRFTLASLSICPFLFFPASLTSLWLWRI